MECDSKDPGFVSQKECEGRRAYFVETVCKRNRYWGLIFIVVGAMAVSGWLPLCEVFDFAKKEAK